MTGSGASTTTAQGSRLAGYVLCICLAVPAALLFVAAVSVPLLLLILLVLPIAPFAIAVYFRRGCEPQTTRRQASR